VLPEVRNRNGEIMSTFIIAIHVIVCIALILIVLLQTGKGADMGAVFGGGSSQTLFGSAGASTFLTKMTTGAAVIFMLTSLSLAYFSGKRPTSSIMPSSVPATSVEDSQEQVPGEMKQSGGVDSKGEESASASASKDTAGADVPSRDTDVTKSPVPGEKSPTTEGDSAGPDGKRGGTG